MSADRRTVDAALRDEARRLPPAKGFVRASFVLPPEIDAELRAEALRQDRSSSAIVREALRNYFARKR